MPIYRVSFPVEAVRTFTVKARNKKEAEQKAQALAKPSAYALNLCEGEDGCCNKFGILSIEEKACGVWKLERENEDMYPLDE